MHGTRSCISITKRESSSGLFPDIGRDELQVDTL